MNKKEIRAKIAEILSDKRLSYRTADIFSNAPLALVQLSMESELHTLQKVIGDELTNIKKLRGEK